MTFGDQPAVFAARVTLGTLENLAQREDSTVRHLRTEAMIRQPQKTASLLARLRGRLYARPEVGYCT
jgi:hypothetical protein